MIALALVAAAAFNLVCVGTQTLSRTGSNQKTEKPSHEVLVVDLQSRRFCFEGCQQTLPITSITPTEIIFQHDVKRQISVFRSVNRESGGMHARVDVMGNIVETDSNCRPAPFTGFAIRKF